MKETAIPITQQNLGFNECQGVFYSVEGESVGMATSSFS